MLEIPTAIGYLRSDISRSRQPWDEIQIRSLARRLGYVLAKTIVFSERTDDPMQRVIDVVRTIDAEAVVIPGLEHFDGYPPSALLAVADVITVSPEQTFSRWVIPPDAPAGMSAR